MDVVLTSAVIATFISGLFTFLQTSQERRKSRAEVLEAIYGIEILRWSDSKHDEFMRAIRKLRAKSLVARSDRRKIELYIYLASVARNASEEHRETRSTPEEYLGSITVELGNLTKSAAELNVKALWAPIRSKLFDRDSVERINFDIEKYKKKIKKTPNELSHFIDWTMRV